MRARAVEWTPARDKVLVAAYLVEDLGVSSIAARMGASVKVISRRVNRLGLWSRLTEAQRKARKADVARGAGVAGLVSRGDGGQFIWTPERVAELRRLFVDEGRSPRDIAARMKCPAHSASRKACDLGFQALRSQEVRRAQQVRVAQDMRAAKVALRAERAEVAARMTDAELVAQAVAAGRVTVVAPAWARGTTRWEGMLHTAPSDKVGGFRFGGGRA